MEPLDRPTCDIVRTAIAGINIRDTRSKKTTGTQNGLSFLQDMRANADFRVDYTRVRGILHEVRDGRWPHGPILAFNIHDFQIHQTPQPAVNWRSLSFNVPRSCSSANLSSCTCILSDNQQVSMWIRTIAKREFQHHLTHKTSSAANWDYAMASPCSYSKFKSRESMKSQIYIGWFTLFHRINLKDFSQLVMSMKS